MKKIVCLLTVLLLCVGMCVPAFAAEDDFVPSITYKPNPEIVPVPDAPGEDVIGVIRGEDGEILDYVVQRCLVITPIAQVLDETVDVPAEVEKLLLFVYNGLNDGSMEIPYEKHGDVDAGNMVIRDLFDVRWTCEEHGQMVEAEGVTFEITFDLGVVADIQIFAMTYDEETKEWTPIASVVNNGDGTVTCTFEHLCAVEFSMAVSGASAAPAEDAQPAANNMLPWYIVLALAVVALVAVVVVKNKKKTAV